MHCTHKQLAGLFRRLHTGYSAGLDIKSLLVRESETGNTTYRSMARRIADDIQRGRSLATAMKSQHGYFPDLVLSVVTAGEQGGRLDDTFDRLANHFESLAQFKRGFLISIAWPLFELAFAVLIIGALIIVMGLVAGDEYANWFGMGTAWANFLFYVVMVLLIVGLATTVCLSLRQGWFGTAPLQIARRIPLVGKTVEAFALSRFAWAMSVTENAGMDALDIAGLSLDATQNYFYKQLVESVRSSLRRGESFSKSFRGTQAFPEDLLIYLENGELSGQLAESMDRASRDYQKRAEDNLKLIGTIGFLLTFLLVAAIIGTVVIVMMNEFYLKPINELL
jgi:type II secretory pathway component PulF